MLKYTDTKIELFTCPEMYRWIENNIRGGISICSGKAFESNHPDMSNYDPSKDIANILMFDQN